MPTNTPLQPLSSLLSAAAALAVAWLGFAAIGMAADSPQNRYNVLLIAIDDLRPELGCYGSTVAQTPHLDRLAAEGVLFTRHYAMVPTCGASRYAMLTGRSPAQSGVRAGNDGFSQGPAKLRTTALDGAQTLPELFRRSGYHTVCLGKISHSPDGRLFAYNGKGSGADELPNAWDELATPFGPWQRGWGVFFAYEGGRHREDGKGHRDLMEFTAKRDRDLPDGMLANAAIQQLEKAAKLGKSAKPFFLGLGFIKPHLPFVAPKQDWDAFAQVAIPPPDSPAKTASPYWHASNEFYGYDFPFEKSRPLAAAARDQSRRAYFACVRYVDRQAGKVLDALDRLGLRDNTIVVVWGDHGWHLGEQQIWGKHSPFERSCRSTFMLRTPGLGGTGVTTNALVEATDIYPTLLDLCNPQFQKTAFPLDGKSLRPLLSGTPAASIHDAAVSFNGAAVSVRSPSHRLIARTEGGTPQDIELYDLTESLDSSENVAAQQPEVVRELLKQIPAANPK